jgi:putative addiction module component (TIGR02574 family)
MSFVTIEKEALELPTQERAKLAQRLLESLDEVPEAEADQLWMDVAVQRAEEIDSGAVQLVSAEDFEAQVQTLLK